MDSAPAERLEKADGLIVRGTVVDAALLARAKQLRVVCRHGVGYDLVDVPVLTERGIALMITPEANAASVAEHALMLMLSLARRVVQVSEGVRRGAGCRRGATGCPAVTVVDPGRRPAGAGGVSVSDALRPRGGVDHPA